MINFTFHHIGIAVFSIEKSSEFYVNQGYEITETVFDPIQNVNICFINCKNIINLVDKSINYFNTYIYFLLYNI